MKKFLGLYDKDEENALKDKIISFTDIPKKYVHFVEIHVSGGEYVHVTFIDDYSVKKEKKDIVLIHGLAGSSLNYFKIFKTFSNEYRIFGVDLPGMGW
jgi:pimeloyl-ACP methyl ester carboxylesterase